MTEKYGSWLNKQYYENYGGFKKTKGLYAG